MAFLETACFFLFFFFVEGHIKLLVISGLGYPHGHICGFTISGLYAKLPGLLVSKPPFHVGT